ncbi:Swa2 protein [Saccharomycopsis crataegensis]|uniref:Swa2 protein n=1 Tax=Saccharomycopsis crataegensis TaxID=43959 RepID=A0AAV5QHM4_9ASCO|nr:Swa2 protein [Saccharomycopsis crataegensis]
MSNKDAFADLFSPKKRDLSKMSLLEQQKMLSNNKSSTSTNNNSWNRLDLLQSSTTSNSIPGSATNSRSSTPSVSMNILSPSNRSSQSINNNNNNNNNASTTDLDDIFGLGIANSSTTVQNLNKNNNGNSYGLVPQKNMGFASQPSSSSVSTSNSNSQDIDSLFSVFDDLPVQQQQQQQQQQQWHNIETPGKTTPQQTFDDKSHQYSSLNHQKPDYDTIPSRPSSRTSRFRDTSADADDGRRPARNGVSNDDHGNGSKNVHQLFDTMAEKSGAMPEDLNSMVNEISNELFSTATSIFNKGKNALNKNIEKYQAQRKAELGGKPAWMYQQAQYKKNGWKEQDEEDAIDFDGTVIRGSKSKNGEEVRHQKFSDPQPSAIQPRRVPQTKPERPQVIQPPQIAKTQPQPKAKPQPQPHLRPEEVLDIFSDLSIHHGPTTNQAPAMSKTKRNEPSISSANLTRFRQFRTLGSNFFKEGNYTSALTNYEDALKLLPPGHTLQIIAYSNLTISYWKVGDIKSALDSVNQGLSMIGNRSLDEVVEDEKSIKEFYLKMNTKKGEILESMEKYKDALECYKLVLENGGASKSVIDAKRRCMEAIAPKPKPKPKPKTPTRTNNSNNNNTNNTGTAAAAAAVRKIKEENVKAENLEQQKYLLYDKVDAKVGQWKHGKEDNIRALLVSLDTILWPETNWKKVGLPDLVMDKKVKINYMKAVAKTHPDKIDKNATVEQQLIAQSVFVTLNKAWDEFKKKNGLN